jgi:DNA-binding MarR family transcriptional regulator/GNAT superfamily N-acetyltransferase
MGNTINDLDEIGLGIRLKKLSEKVFNDISKIYSELNIDSEPYWFAIAHYLSRKELDEMTGASASIQEIADSLNLSHPAIINFVSSMSNKKLVTSFKDPLDKRKRAVRLTEKGKEAFEKLKPVLSDIENAVKEINNDCGYDIIHVMNSLEKVLDEKSLFQRIKELNKKRLLEEVEIIRYSPNYKEYFKNLNLEWIIKYFTVEPEDVKVLSNPEKEIINKGGEVFFASINNEIIGTCAVIKREKDVYELAKMAVTEKARNRQAGKKLALSAIGYAYSKGAASLILETNSKLIPALRLYEKLGFEYIPGIFESKYGRATLRMKLDLK